MKLIICEDEPAIAEQITGLVQGWASCRGKAVRIARFKSAEAFLFAYEDDKSVDLILLDIQMGGMDGMALARKIREDNDRVQIIFVTGISDYVAEGYDVSAAHYLLKPVKEEKLYSALDKAVARISLPKRIITIDTAEGIVLVAVDDIVYIESLDHELIIHLRKNDVSCKMPLYKMEEALSDERFVKAHRSYLVNLAFVKRISRTDVILDDGTALPLSRRLYKDINRLLMKYVTGGMK
jgi:DNA-binding LytR/AlgR family response regulator